MFWIAILETVKFLYTKLHKFKTAFKLTNVGFDFQSKDSKREWSVHRFHNVLFAGGRIFSGYISLHLARVNIVKGQFQSLIHRSTQ